MLSLVLIAMMLMSSYQSAVLVRGHSVRVEPGSISTDNTKCTQVRDDGDQGYIIRCTDLIEQVNPPSKFLKIKKEADGSIQMTYTDTCAPDEEAFCLNRGQ